jgi:hypothetical protein
MQADAHASFPCPGYVFVLDKAFSQKAAVRHPMKIATIRLQWNRKPKMMPLAKVVLPNKPGHIFN